MDDKLKTERELVNRYNQGLGKPGEQLLVQAALNDLAKSLPPRQAADEDAIGAAIWAGLPVNRQKTRVRKLRTRFTVAASLLLVSAFGLFFYLTNNNSPANNHTANDIAPGKQGATLTLANGNKISLAHAVNGTVATEAGITISKAADGQLVYEMKGNTKGNKRNTLATAKGETYIVTLPDKSKVWLNAASSLTYSASLNERGLRRVRLEGEAYFEVAKDKKHPFIVESAGQQVEVLGTHFNVNAYKEENIIATTLIEGAVKVRSGKHQQLIKPGQQALNDGAKIVVRQANIENITDWKNGEFYLNRVNFREAMRKIARWYDVEIIYADNLPESIETGGWISRNNQLSSVLKLIEKSDIAHFKLEGRKLYVSK